MTSASQPAGYWKFLAPILIFALLAGGLAASRGLIVMMYLHDVFIPFDALWRVTIGDVPHVDFHSPLGQAYFWPFMILGRLGDHDALTVVHAHILVGGVLAAAIALLLPRRLSMVELVISTVVILAIAMSPREVDGTAWEYSWLASYNRWSWALWMLTVQALLIAPDRERPLVDGIVLGLLGGLVFYMKITFFAGAGLFVLLALALRTVGFRTVLVAAVTLAVLMLGVELTWHNNLGYLSDLRMAAQGAAEGHGDPRYRRLKPVGASASFFWVIVPALFWLARPEASVAQWARAWRPQLIICGAVLVIGMLLSVQNFSNREYGHLVLAVLIAWQLIRRASATPAALLPVPPGPTASKRAIVMALLIAASLLFTAKDVWAIGGHAVATRDGAFCRIPELAGTQGADLMAPVDQLASAVPRAAGPSCDNLAWWPKPANPDGNRDFFYLHKLERTMQLLHAHARPGEVIATIDFSNPYPFFLRTQTPKGALLWSHLSRSYGYRAHPPVDPMLRTIDLAVQAKPQFNQDFVAGQAWVVYGPAVSRYFHVVAENDSVRLWRRNGR